MKVNTEPAEKSPTFIAHLPSGWVSLYKFQFLRGYCVLRAEPVVESINVLGDAQRAQYLKDMVLVGDALLEVTGAYRINYAIMGNFDPKLHAHIVPRYLSEPDDLRFNPPWSYPKETQDTILFDAYRDHDLMCRIAKAIQARM